MNATLTSPSPLWMRVVFGRNPKRTLVRLLCMVSCSFIMFHFVLIPIRVSGMSMAPTFKDGKISVINHLSYRWGKPRRGDVIAFRYPGNLVLLKRIVGLPGEKVRIKQGLVYINNRPLSEPYADIRKNPPNRDEYRLGSDEYFVIGDNRDITVSGPIYGESILGKVLF